MTQDEIIRMAREAGSIDSEDVIETVWAAFAAAEQAEQEPVVWAADGECRIRCKTDGTTEHYAGPVRTKDLTDGAIWEILETHPTDIITAIRAVIAADREKNK